MRGELVFPRWARGGELASWQHFLRLGKYFRLVRPYVHFSSNIGLRVLFPSKTREMIDGIIT